MRILLVHPRFPITYWGFQYGLPFAGKRASLPPLGLLTVAGHLPRDWELRLVDLNIRDLDDADLRWADAVLTGGMRVQSPSMHDVLARARALGRHTVVGGPAPTTSPGEFADADVVFTGELEGREETLLAALRDPAGAPRLLASDAPAPEMARVPVPRFDLLEMRDYASMSIQYSRGCPYTCEFCDIIEIYGRVPRVKAPAQIVAEMQALWDAGWEGGGLFVVDDNFIGNSRAVKKLLPEIQVWQEAHGFPYEMYTEASVNLAADEELLAAMVSAGFNSVFLGIETPSEEALLGAGKKQNLRLDLVDAVDRIARAGLEPMGGFIVGFDSDGPEAFDLQRRFIESSPIPLAMVGLMIALPGTALWKRLKREGRLREPTSGDQFDRPNFVPTMDEAAMLRGYADLLASIYSPESYLRRCLASLERIGVPKHAKAGGRPGGVWMLFNTALKMGTGKRRKVFWKLLYHAVRKSPLCISWAVVHAIQGEHLMRYTEEDVLPRLRKALAEVVAEQASPAVRRAPAAQETAAVPEALVPVAQIRRARR